jgi:sugar phosphate isomerase/epimerase
MDFAALAAALGEIRYDRWATVELYTQAHDPDTAARRSLTHLAPVL